MNKGGEIRPKYPKTMKTTPIYRLAVRLVLWTMIIGFLTTTTGQLVVLLCGIFLFYGVARLVLSLVWKLFLGVALILIIILLIF